jgi:hypothetical protein
MIWIKYWITWIKWEIVPFRSLVIVELISHVVVWPLRSLYSKAIDYRHFLGNKFLGLCISSCSSEWKLWRRGLLTLLHISKARVDFSVGEFDEILVGVDFLRLVFLGFYLCHELYLCNFL